MVHYISKRITDLSSTNGDRFRAKGVGQHAPRAGNEVALYPGDRQTEETTPQRGIPHRNAAFGANFDTFSHPSWSRRAPAENKNWMQRGGANEV